MNRGDRQNSLQLRPRSLAIRGSRLGLAVLLPALILLQISCDDSSSPQKIFTGQLRGYILTPEGPAVGFEVEARRSDLENPTRATSTRTQDDGYFEIPLVAGPYILVVDRPNGPDVVYNSGVFRPNLAQAEVIEVAHEEAVPPIEGHFGSLELEVRAPTLEGEEIEVELQSPIFRSRISDQTATVADGVARLSFHHLPAGDVRVIVEFGAGSRIEAIPLIEGNPVDNVGIVAGSVVEYVATLPEPSRFSIEVDSYLLDGYEESSIALFLERADDGFRFDTVEVFENGLFEFETLERANFHIVPIHIGPNDHRSVFRLLSGYIRKREPAIVFEPGSTTQVPKLESCTLELLFDCGTDRGLEIGDIIAWNEDGTEVVGQFRVSSEDPTFRRVYSGFLPGTIQLEYRTFRGDEHFHLDQWFSTDGGHTEPTPIDLGESGNQTTLEWNMIQGGRMQGIVVNADGIPQTDLVLTLTTAESDNFEGNLGRVDQFGRFDAGALRDGSYKLGAVRHPAITRWYPGVEDWEDAEVITISDLNVIDGLEFVFQ